MSYITWLVLKAEQNRERKLNGQRRRVGCSTELAPDNENNKCNENEDDGNSNHFVGGHADVKKLATCDVL